MNNLLIFAKKNAPTILSSFAVGGVVGTAVMAVAETPKAIKILDDEKKKKGEVLTSVETIKATWKCYYPAIFMGAATISCIIAANSINLKRNAALLSACSFSEKSFKEYKDVVKDTIGEEKEQEIKDKIFKNHPEPDGEPTEGEGFTDKILCYIPFTKKYFYSTVTEVTTAELNLNQHFTQNGMCSLNDFYNWLGIPPTDYGDTVGWYVDDDWETYFIPFRNNSALSGSGKPCYVIDFLIEPSISYMNARYY